MKYLFRPSAEKQFLKLNPVIQKRIVEKLSFYLQSPSPIIFAERLTNYEIGHRREIYR